MLKTGVEQHPDKPGLAMQYALALDDLEQPFNEAVAALQLASLYGCHDPCFIATLGGMLFLNGDFTDAKEVFARSADQAFTYRDRSAPRCRSREPEGRRSPLRLQGSVVSV
ncbi:MAG: hypothetical protein OXG37_01290 [Actinomycetia bacterium]|nr:hypothetical protein [Actinomycetes bacterium]